MRSRGILNSRDLRAVGLRRRARTRTRGSPRMSHLQILLAVWAVPNVHQPGLLIGQGHPRM